MRFTVSLRKDETAKTVRPTGVPEKGPVTVRTRPVVLPKKDRMRMVLRSYLPALLAPDRSGYTAPIRSAAARRHGAEGRTPELPEA